MNATALSRLACAALLFVSPVIPSVAPRLSAAEITTVFKPEEGRLEWNWQGRRILEYAFATNQFKPYVREFRTPGGDNVLRDAPADHLHHHGLMYAIRVNGINFWEEVGECGIERSVKLLPQTIGPDALGRPRARFAQMILWVPHASRFTPNPAAALLVEKRTLTLTVDESGKEAALEWNADFEAGPGAEKIRLHGSEYNGLGLRLPVAFDHAARHQNSENTPYKDPTQRDVITARWSAITGKIENRDISVGLFARSEAIAGTTRFFTMLDPFCYLSVTQNLDKTPIEYKKGDHFSVRYLLIVSDGPRDAAQWEARHANWLKEGGGK